jgi:hypothetical protein
MVQTDIQFIIHDSTEQIYLKKIEKKHWKLENHDYQGGGESRLRDKIKKEQR